MRRVVFLLSVTVFGLAIGYVIYEYLRLSESFISAVML